MASSGVAVQQEVLGLASQDEAWLSEQMERDQPQQVLPGLPSVRNSNQSLDHNPFRKAFEGRLLDGITESV
ncbi:hypothetical protein CI238_00852 [Colletotrichum incanum]|uniref:Uncharacterized protein n=1 Tax=Colletotrichum incanum TaxID=1573173 RepID=A0A166THC5_COLIC|nr:hypothetical protein CI238_00852 [Colletotrichum incanum]